MSKILNVKNFECQKNLECQKFRISKFKSRKPPPRVGKKRYARLGLTKTYNLQSLHILYVDRIILRP